MLILSDVALIILDIIVVLVILGEIVLSALKGIKHTLINFILLAGTVALCFSPLLAPLNNAIVDLLKSQIALNDGNAATAKLAFYMAYPFIASLLLTIVIYLVLRLLKTLIQSIVKRKRAANNRLPKKVGIASRVSGGVVGAILHGALVIVLTSILASPFVAGASIEKSHVTKYVAMADDLLIDFVVPDNKDNRVVQNHVLISLLKANLYAEVSNEDAAAFNKISEYVSGKRDKLVDTQLSETTKNKIFLQIKELVTVMANIALDADGKLIEAYKPGIEEFGGIMNTAITSINKESPSSQYAVKGTNSLASLLGKLGCNDAKNAFLERFNEAA